MEPLLRADAGDVETDEGKTHPVAWRVAGSWAPPCQAALLAFLIGAARVAGDSHGFKAPSLPLAKTELSPGLQPPLNAHPRKAEARVCRKRSPGRPEGVALPRS